jgi:23S rRNA (uracil1939-C5)-methyltransferase
LVVWYGSRATYRHPIIKANTGIKLMRRAKRNDGHLPRNARPLEVEIMHIGGRGDGIGTASYTHKYETKEYTVFVPASLPGEIVRAQPLSINAQGIKARILELQRQSDDRQTPGCNSFPACGGCNFQHWSRPAIASWKQDLVAHFMSRHDLSPDDMRPMQSSPPASRRRATFQIKRLQDSAIVGFHERNSHHIVAPDGCVILEPALVDLQSALHDFASQHLDAGTVLTAHANLLDNGICVLLSGLAKWPSSLLAALTDWAGTPRFAGAPLARLSVGDGHTPMLLFAPTPAEIRFGDICIDPPAGAFLQATRHGEASLQAAVAEITTGASRVIDLFAGCGTLSVPLVSHLTHLLAVEQDGDSLATLKAGANKAKLGARVKTMQRDLMNAPIQPVDLDTFDAAIIDPPRNGAAAQCAELALSQIPVIAMVSCNPATFARDAETLTYSGYRLDWMQVIDQFLFSNHLEIVARFSKIKT